MGRGISRWVQGCVVHSTSSAGSSSSTVTLWGMVPAVPKIISLPHHHGVSSGKCLSSDLCYQLWHVTLFDNCMGAAVLWVPSRPWSLGRDLASFMPFCFPDGVGKHSLGDNKVPRWKETKSMNPGERIAIFWSEIPTLGCYMKKIYTSLAFALILLPLPSPPPRFVCNNK